MKVTKTSLLDALIIEDIVYSDDRGFFKESWNKRVFKDNTKINEKFVQDNHSRSQKGVLRGLHYQYKKPQGKLVRVVNGKVLDVIVDLRKKSKTFSKYFAIELSDTNHKQLWIPKGFAHGFLVLSSTADFLYKTTEYYDPSDEQCLLWNDKLLNIDWKIKNIIPKISEKDKNGKKLEEALIFK